MDHAASGAHAKKTVEEDTDGNSPRDIKDELEGMTPQTPERKDDLEGCAQGVSLPPDGMSRENLRDPEVDSPCMAYVVDKIHGHPIKILSALAVLFALVVWWSQELKIEKEKVSFVPRSGGQKGSPLADFIDGPDAQALHDVMVFWCQHCDLTGLPDFETERKAVQAMLTKSQALQACRDLSWSSLDEGSTAGLRGLNYLSPDRTTSFVEYHSVSRECMQKVRHELQKEFYRTHGDMLMALGGPEAVAGASMEAELKTMMKHALIAVPLSCLLLWLFVGNLFRTITPVVCMVFAYLSGQATVGLIKRFSHSLNVNYNDSFVLFLDLALCVDYALFFWTRFTHERIRLKFPEALRKAHQTSGMVILISNFFVTVAYVCTLCFPDLNLWGFRALYIEALASCTSCGLYSVILTPAFAAALPKVFDDGDSLLARGHKAFWERCPKSQNFWRPWAKAITSKPLMIVLPILAYASMAPFVVTLGSYKPSYDIQKQGSRSDTMEHRALEQFASHFSVGMLSPVTLVLEAHDLEEDKADDIPMLKMPRREEATTTTGAVVAGLTDSADAMAFELAQERKKERQRKRAAASALAQQRRQQRAAARLGATSISGANGTMASRRWWPRVRVNATQASVEMKRKQLHSDKAVVSPGMRDISTSKRGQDRSEEVARRRWFSQTAAQGTLATTGGASASEAEAALGTGQPANTPWRWWKGRPRRGGFDGEMTSPTAVPTAPAAGAPIFSIHHVKDDAAAAAASSNAAPARAAPAKVVAVAPLATTPAPPIAFRPHTPGSPWHPVDLKDPPSKPDISQMPVSMVAKKAPVSMIQQLGATVSAQEPGDPGPGSFLQRQIGIVGNALSGDSALHPLTQDFAAKPAGGPWTDAKPGDRMAVAAAAFRRLALHPNFGRVICKLAEGIVSMTKGKRYEVKVSDMLSIWWLPSAVTGSSLVDSYGCSVGAAKQARAAMLTSSQPNLESQLLSRMPPILQHSISPDGNKVQLKLFTRFSPSSPEAAQLDFLIRDHLENTGRTVEIDGKQYALRLHHASAIANQVEANKQLAAAAPKIFGIFAALAAVLITVTFRSAFLSLKLALTVLFPILSTYGVAIAVYQLNLLGWLGIEAFSATGGLDFRMIYVTPGVLFGLAMDYDLFLFVRVYEHRCEGYDNTSAVRRALAETGPVITAAGVLMAVSFFAILMSDTILFRTLGFVFFFGVSFDVFIVRTCIAPVFLCLAENLNYWPRAMPPVTKSWK